ncbi:hypothetical protein HU200_009487 [Digitaria exilis]|uniref:Peptidase A1 domain-containing protein n=1 Tax=Digitaria exilis TaxID=1010633 RepID=A0A835FL03_9POAL|nr:hypothetical protein HU200_009487 [Digitaria exilis]
MNEVTVSKQDSWLGLAKWRIEAGLDESPDENRGTPVAIAIGRPSPASKCYTVIFIDQARARHGAAPQADGAAARRLSLLPLPLAVVHSRRGYTGGNGDGGGKPLVTAITKDAATKLYTAPLKDKLPLVLDLSGPLIWTSTYECHHHACAHAHSYHPPDCPRTGHGVADEDDPFRCKCTAHPYNPVARRSASGDLTRVTVTANDTVGHNPLHPVSFPAVAACAPPSLLANLPAGAAGVAGLARSRVSLPVQAARAQKVANKFALCLPSGGNGVGVAIFGGGPLFLLPPGSPDVTARLAGTTPLVRKAANPGYYVSAKGGVAVNQEGVQRGPLVVGLSSRVPYTELRSDVYGAVVKAFDKATAGRKRVTPAVAPFELCYDSRELGSTRLGYAVPQVDLMMDGGANWTVFGGNSLVQMDDNTACFGFVKMPPEEEEKAAAAVVIGGFQMENNLLVFDEEKQQLGFSGLLFDQRLTSSSWILLSSPRILPYPLDAYTPPPLLPPPTTPCLRTTSSSVPGAYPPPPDCLPYTDSSLPSSVIPHHHRLPIGSTRAPAAAAIANQLKIDAHVTSTGSTRGPPLPAVPPPLCCHLDNLHHRPASYPKLPLCHW